MVSPVNNNVVAKNDNNNAVLNNDNKKWADRRARWSPFDDSSLQDTGVITKTSVLQGVKGRLSGLREQLSRMAAISSASGRENRCEEAIERINRAIAVIDETLNLGPAQSATSGHFSPRTSTQSPEIDATGTTKSFSK